MVTPTDPVLALELGRDGTLAALSEEYCSRVTSQGQDPNSPPESVTPFLGFAHHEFAPHIDATAKSQYERWKSVSQADLEIRWRERGDAAQKVTHAWGEPLQRLDQLLSLAEEFGLIHVRRLEAARGALPIDHRVLLGLHSRGVQVAEETLALLRCGFAAGAEARWRTLHEIAVVASFIAQRGAATAERYVLHDSVQLKIAMEQEQRHHEALGLDPYTPEEIDEIQRKVADLEQRFGPVYLRDWGWAAADFGRTSKNNPPTFLDIEASLNFSHFRPAYRSASQAIHAGPSGFIDHPGRREGWTPALLTGPTEFGLGEPGSRTAKSIWILSRALMELQPFPFDLVGIRAMKLLAAEVAHQFQISAQRLNDLTLT